MSECPPHHWRIEEQSEEGQGESEGVCKKCGEVKPFRNWVNIDYRDWSLDRILDKEEHVDRR